MERIGIFHLYNKCGIVESYIEKLLESMVSILSKLIIVINGDLGNMELCKLERFSDFIYIRENVGYDAGAYKDIFLELHQEDWKQWDEIILFNSTFYGPFYSWDNIFEVMSKKEIDFWGLSRHLGGVQMRKGGSFAPEHIQSYFLAIRRRIVNSSSFWKFWKKMEYPESYYEAVENFEWEFTSFFKSCGFNYTTFLDQQMDNPYKLGKGIDFCIEYAYSLVSEYKFPIAKCKLMSIGYFTEAKALMEFVKFYTVYDPKLIENHVKHLIVVNKWRPFSPVLLEKFVKEYDHIYILGHGKYGRGVEAYFEYMGWKVSAFVVTTPKNNEISFETFILKENDGLIIALGSLALEEMKEQIYRKFNKEQLLFPVL